MPGKIPDMPREVSEIESAIDAISGAASYVSGDETTLQRLRAEHWNFRSTDAGHAVRMLLSDCRIAMAREFIDAGAPVDVTGEGWGKGLPVGMAARCADVDLVRVMLSKGALKRRADSKSFLWMSVASGDPRMVALALERFDNVNSKGEEGVSLLAQVGGSHPDDDARAKVVDPLKVVDLLVAAGADLNARDDEGQTALFATSDAAIAEALIRHGADPNARDNAGRTALFDRYDDVPRSVLVAAGADVNAHDKAGRTPLFLQTDADSIRVLLDLGADVDAVDANGRTAIEGMNSEEATAALLAGGAKLPADPARLKAMIDRATVGKWTEVLERLNAAAVGR
jgi:ankyrin repeat protein